MFDKSNCKKISLPLQTIISLQIPLNATACDIHKSESTTWSTYCLEGNHHLENKEYKKAVQDYTFAVFLFPNAPAVVFRALGRAYDGLNKTNKALRSYLAALKRDPSDPATHGRLATIYRMKYEVTNERDYCQEAAKHYSYYLSKIKRARTCYYFEAGFMHFLIEDYEKAYSYYKLGFSRGIETQRSMPLWQIYFNFSTICSLMEKKEEAKIYSDKLFQNS